MLNPKMKKLVVAVAVAGGVIAAGYSARAGQKTSNPASVDITNRAAAGGLGSTRSTADIYSYVGCATYRTSTDYFGVCQARNAAAESGSCITRDPMILANIRAVTPGTFVYYTWDINGNCDYVQIRTMSNMQPMVP